MVINCPGDHHFRAVLTTMGREDLLEDERYSTRSARVTHTDEVDALVESWTKLHTKKEVADLMLKANVPCSAIRELGEVMVDENMHARGSLQWIDHPDMGRVVLPHSPMRYEGTEMVKISPSHKLGADNHHVYGDWLGVSDETLAEYEKKGVF